MVTVSVRELRNEGAAVLDRVERGETLVVTRDGRPVAELRPLTPARVSIEDFQRAWATLPPIDPDELHAGIDVVIDQRW